jgi:hypothetical protein
MHADMTDKDAMMTVTLTVPPQLVQKHAEKILPRNGISITNFNILPKTVYDRGDCDRIISLNEASIVEKIPAICSEYRFLSDSTISQLAQSTDIYPIRNDWGCCDTGEKIWVATHSPYKGWRFRQRQGNGTAFHIQFCSLLLRLHVCQISYTNLALFHVAATIVRYVFRFVFVNGTTIA